MKTIIIQNNVTDKVTLLAGTKMVADKLKTIGIGMSFVFVESTKTFTGLKNDYTDTTGTVIHSYIVKPSEVIEASKPYQADAYCLVYDWTKVTPQPTHPADGGIYMQIPTQWYTDTTKTPNIGYAEVFCQYFLHELCHNLIPDLTHNQYQNPAWSQKPPTDYYLYLLKTYMKPNQTTVTLTRKPSTKKETLGKLSLVKNGTTFTCETLELPWLDNAKNISCIPKGTYQAKWTFSPKFLRYTYQVMNVPNRDGIRIHPGNYFKDFQGCIGMGQAVIDLNHDGELDITNTKVTVGAFEALMNKETFTLIIK